MKRGWKMLLITLIVGVPAFFLGPVIWSPSPDIQPTQAQMPFLIALSAVEALVFGFGVAFILYGRRLVRSLAGGSRKAAGAMHGSLSWILVSWWPHDNLHIHNALNINGLIVIEYLFHFTVIVAGLVIAYSFFALFKPATEGIEKAETCVAGRPDCHPSPARL